MKTSEILRRVRTHLGDDEIGMTMSRRYCCFAVDYLYYNTRVIRDKDRTRIKKLLLTHLEGKRTLEQWLHDNHDIQYKGTPRYIRKIMATRKAWLTHLIEHYEAKGE